MAIKISVQYLVSLLAVLFLSLVLAWMGGVFDNKIEPDLRDTAMTKDVGAFQAHEVQLLDNIIYEPVSGTVRAKHATDISSRILARITRIHVRAGDSVKKGQLLLELEQSELQLRSEQARERQREVSIRLAEAKQNLARVQTLHTKGLVAQNELDASKAVNDSLIAELAAAERGFRETEAMRGYSAIRAPIAGRVIDRFAEPGDTASPGVKLLSIYNPLSLRVEAPVREKLALGLEPGQQLDVEIPSLNLRLQALIEEQVPAADIGSRSFLIKAQVNYEPRLLPGVYARLFVPAGKEQLLVIPQQLVKSIGQLDVVWVRTALGVERRFIRLGKQIDLSRVAVVSGLRVGEQLVAAPQ